MPGRRSWFRYKNTRPARTDHRGYHREDTGTMRRVERRRDPMKIKKDAKSKGTILIADYDFGDVNIERAIIEGAGFEILAAQCKSEDEVIEHGREADGVLAQYAPIGARAINAFTHWRGYCRCRRRHTSRHTGHERPERVVCRGGRRPRRRALARCYPQDLPIRPGSPARRMALADGSPYLAHPWAHFRPRIVRRNRTQHRGTREAIRRRHLGV